MKRRTVTVEIEIEGGEPDPFELRDEILRVRYGAYWKVIDAEIVENGAEK